MFDLSFSKLILIGVIALIVVGPEKLPRIARMAGTLLGRAQRYFNDVKAEVGREMAIDDLHHLKEEVRATSQEIESSFTALKRDTAADEAPFSEAYKLKARQFRRNKYRNPPQRRQRAISRSLRS